MFFLPMDESYDYTLLLLHIQYYILTTLTTRTVLNIFHVLTLEVRCTTL